MELKFAWNLRLCSHSVPSLFFTSVLIALAFLKSFSFSAVICARLMTLEIVPIISIVCNEGRSRDGVKAEGESCG
eukprot:IDg1393t1